MCVVIAYIAGFAVVVVPGVGIATLQTGVILRVVYNAVRYVGVTHAVEGEGHCVRRVQVVADLDLF